MMTGLEKVTGKIIADAEADAREALAAADERCAEISAEYQRGTDAELERMREASDRECQGLIVRARSSAVMAKRNVLLEARAAIVSEAYAIAERQIRAMSGDAYLELLTKMLRTSLKQQLEAEEESLRLYGEDISPETYEVLLTEHDRDLYGDRLPEVFRHGLGAKFPPEALAKLVVSPETPPASALDGGLILRCGPVETNCSLSALLAQNRRQTEVRVSKILFGEA